MAAGNCSVEAAVIENGKSVKGTLTLFIDEYVFGSKRKNINWEKAECKKGTVTVSYNKVTGATKYQIYRSEKKNGKYTLVGTSKKTTFADKKVKKKKTYYYKVVASGKNALLADFSVESSKVKIKVKK